MFACMLLVISVHSVSMFALARHVEVDQKQFEVYQKKRTCLHALSFAFVYFFFLSAFLFHFVLYKNDNLVTK